MAEGLLVESISKQAFDDVERFTFDILEAIEVTADWEKGLKKLGLPSQVKKSFSEANIALDQAAKTVSEYEKSQKKLEDRMKKQERTISSLVAKIKKLSTERGKGNKKLTEEQKLADRVVKTKKQVELAYTNENKKLIGLRQTKNEVNKLTRLEERAANVLLGVYNQLDAELSIMSNEYRNLAIRKELFDNLNEKEIRRMDSLEGKIQQYYGALSKVDQKLGKFGRNVGNYKSGFDGLGFSVAQLTREMPAFANSMQTGFMAISNNIPMLVDEINTLRNANKSLAAEGKPTVGILKSLGKAMFSWHTVISIGVTLLTVYGAKLFDLALGMSESEKATEEANKAIEEQNKSLKENIRLRKQALNEASGFIDSVEIADEFRELLNGSIVDSERAGLALIELSDRMSELNIKNADAIKDANLLQSDRIRIGLNSLEIAKQQNKLAEERLRINDEVVKKTEILKQFREGEITATVKTAKLAQLESTNLSETLKIQGRIKQLSDENNRLSGKGVELEKDKSKAAKSTTSIYEAIELRYQAVINMLQRIAESEKTSTDNQILANEQLVARQIELADLRMEHELKQSGISAIDRMIIQERYYQDLERINRESRNRLEEISDTAIEREKNRTKRKTDAVVAALTEEGKQQQDALKEQLINREITIEEFQKQERKIKIDSAKAVAMARLKLLRAELEAEKAAGKDVGATLEAIKEIERKILDLDVEGFKLIDLDSEGVDKELEFIEGAFTRFGASLGIQASTIKTLFDQYKEGFKDVGAAAGAFGNLMIDIANNIAQAQNAKIERHIQGLQQEKEVALLFAGDSAAAREQIEERYAEKIARLRTRQAKNEKNAAKTSAIINTAVAVVKTFAELGWPAGIPAAAIIAALGAAEVAVIASTPIPAFQDGVRNFEGGPALINERVQEVVTTPDGQVLRPRGRNILVDLPKGANVYRNEQEFQNEMNGILGMNGINPIGPAVMNSRIPRGYSSANGFDEGAFERVLNKTLAKQPKNVTTIDKRGINTTIHREATRARLLNNRVTFKGQSV